MTRKIRLRFTGPPGPDPSKTGFIEAEDTDGASVSVGEWRQDPDSEDWFLEIEVAESRTIDDIIEEHGEGSEGYEASAQAAVDETFAAFRSAAHRYGLTGFQASWVAMQVLQQINGWEGPLLVLRAEDMLYPQYEPPIYKAARWATSDDVQDWLGKQAKEKLKKPHGAHNVRDHWRMLAGEE